jgi:hypothetical protein
MQNICKNLNIVESHFERPVRKEKGVVQLSHSFVCLVIFKLETSQNGGQDHLHILFGKPVKCKELYIALKTIDEVSGI